MLHIPGVEHQELPPAVIRRATQVQIRLVEGGGNISISYVDDGKQRTELIFHRRPPAWSGDSPGDEHLGTILYWVGINCRIYLRDFQQPEPGDWTRVVVTYQDGEGVEQVVTFQRESTSSPWLRYHATAAELAA